jgi:tetratricopeptide (TPR) repeat protein
VGSEIKVTGYVTWIYDCADALAAGHPRASRAELVQLVDEDPRQCERPRFYLGDARTTSRDASITVVDVPRRPAKPERDSLSRAELDVWPAVPRLAVGDYVVVTGTWGTESHHGERNTSGLLTYKALQHAAPAPASPGGAAAPAPRAIRAPEAPVVTRPPLREEIDVKTRNASVDHLNACSQAIRARRYDAGLAECHAATKIWDGNHLAWYGAATAYVATSKWAEARAAAERAVTLRPDQAMYQLYHGIALYEADHERARSEPTPRDHNPAAEVTRGPPAISLDAARDALLRAATLAPGLWRAHYYLGRTYRDLDDSRHAAEQFTLAIATHPSYRSGYIALIELYRRWDYLDQALAVALLGTTHVPASEAPELWYEAGMAYDAKLASDPAVAAFTKAIAARPDDASAKFQRGQVYARKGELANAARDLEEVIQSADPQVAELKVIATQLLGQIASKQQLRDRANCTTGERCIPALPGDGNK